MTISEVLELEATEVYPNLCHLLLTNPDRALHTMEEFRAFGRYESDYVYRAAVDSANLVANGLLGRHDEVISLAPEIIERTEALELWKLVAINWNNLGTTFAALQSLESALECYCRVINTEKRHGANELTSIAYYNLSLIFMGVDAYRKAVGYIEKAIDSIRMMDLELPQISARYLLYLSLHLQLLCRVDEIDRAHSVYTLLTDMVETQTMRESLFAYYVAKMYYVFYATDRKDCLSCYEKVMSLIDESDVVRKYITIHAYVELCEKFGHAPNVYGEQLTAAERLPEIPSYLILSSVYKQLKRYYQAIGDDESVRRIMPKYVEYLEKTKEHYAEQQFHSLETVESLMLGSSNSEVSEKNVELKLLANEAIKNKNALEDAYRRLEKISLLDGLTHIGSRRDFEARFSSLLEEAEKADQNVVVFMLDIDFFKAYNDTYGHLEGDEILKKVALIFRNNLERYNGIAARYGGEEFIGACRGLKLSEYKEIAEQIRQDVFNLHIQNANTMKRIVTVSIGVGVASGAGSGHKEELMKFADRLLYEAKNTGRDKVVYGETVILA